MKYKIYAKPTHIEQTMSDDGRTYNPKTWMELQGYGDNIPSFQFKIPAPTPFVNLKNVIDLDVEVTVKVTPKKK